MPNLSLKKLKQKKIRLSASYGKRRLYYFLTALIATLLVLAGSFLDESLGIPYISLFVKFGLAWLAFMLAKQSGYLDPEGDGRLFSPCFLLILPPLIFALLCYLGPFRPETNAYGIVLAVLGILSTALWEELYFRLWGRILFETEGQYRTVDMLFLALTFGAMHLVNLASAPFSTVIPQVMLAVVTALFLQTLYAAGGSLRLVVVFHFLLNLTAGLVPQHLVPDAQSRLFPSLEGTALPLLALYYVLAAAVLSRRKKLLSGGDFRLFKRKGKGR